MSTTVVVPTWNGAQRLSRLLRSLSPALPTIVVDNGSTDATPPMVANRFPHVTLLSLPRNEGFSRAVNRGVASASTSSVVILNDDCVCEPGFAETLGEAIDPGSGVTMAAGVLLEEHRPEVIDSAGLDVDDTLQVFDYLNGAPVSILDNSIEAPLGPSGAAAAFDRRSFLALGGFDERLFAYWEDVDLTLRLRLAGGTCRLITSPRAVHSHSATLGAGSRRKNYLTGFGRGYMLRKWGLLRGRRIGRVIAYESLVCLSQLVVDRTGAGAWGRIDGWREGSATERLALPSVYIDGRRFSLAVEARRRWQRRRRLQEAYRR